MPAAYFDSSAVLAFVLQQPEGGRALDLWEGEASRCSSILLKAECLGALRRLAARGVPGVSRNWMQERSQCLEASLAEVHLKDVDASVLEALEREPALADCRALDALHLATALYLRERASEGFRLVTFDDRMRRTGLKLGFEVGPA